MSALRRFDWVSRRQAIVCPKHFALRRPGGAAVLLAIALYRSQFLLAAEPNDIRDLATSRQFFNPSIGQTVEFTFTLEAAGLLTFSIMNSDGAPVCRLLVDKRAKAGKQSVRWDGRDDHSRLVKDEAYSPRVALRIPGSSRPIALETHTPTTVAVPTPSYDAPSGVLSYNLPVGCRVWIEASAILNAPGDPPRIVKVEIASGAPRISGSVIDQWNGFDGTKTLYLPKLEAFALTAHAVTLPSHFVITIGNHRGGAAAASNPPTRGR